MSPTLSTFLIEAANFLILTAGLGWAFFRPVRRALAAEQKAQAEVQARAEQERAEAERVRAEIASRQAMLNEELERLRSAARIQASKDAESILRNAREAAEREQAAARLTLDAERKASADALADELAALSAQAILSLLAWLEGPEWELALARAARKELADVSGAWVIETAQPLDDRTRDALKTVVDGHPVEFRVNPQLGAGLRIVTQTGLADASAAGLSAFARREIARKLQARLEHAGD